MDANAIVPVDITNNSERNTNLCFILINGSVAEHYTALETISEIICDEPNPTIEDFVPLIPTFVECLKVNYNTTIQINAIRIINKIATATPEHIFKVVNAGGVPLLIKLLTTCSMDVCSHSVFCLGSIMAHGAQMCTYVIELGLIGPLLAFINANVPNAFLCNVTWILVTICQSGCELLSVVIPQILPVLNQLILHTNIGVLNNVLLCIDNIAQNKNRIHLLLQSGILPPLITLLTHAHTETVIIALRAIGNMLAGTDQQTEVIIASGALSYFTALLLHPEQQIRKETLWALSNITAANEVLIEAVVHAGLLPYVISNAINGDLQTQCEATWVICNLTLNGNKNQIILLVIAGVVPALCSLLDCNHMQTISNALESIYNILQKAGAYIWQIINTMVLCGGLYKVAQLKYHEDIEVYMLAFKIIDRFFGNNLENTGFPVNADTAAQDFGTSQPLQ